MKILITGIHGFVGPYLQRELESAHEVFGIDVATKEKNIFQCDLQSFDQINDVIATIQPDAVAHLAALSSVAQSWNNPQMIVDLNRTMTQNIYKAIETQKLHSKVLLISSAEVYAKDQAYPLTESSAIGPTNPYAESKVAQEKVTKKFPNIPTVISRSFNHTGPGQRDIFVLSSFAKQIAEIEQGKKEILLVGNLDAKRDFSDVRDVVRAYRLLLEEGPTGEIYNVCSGKSYPVSDLLSMLVSQSTTKITVKQDPDRLRPSDTPEFWGTYTKIQKHLGWKPEISLEKTLSDLLVYWRKEIST